LLSLLVGCGEKQASVLATYTVSAVTNKDYRVESTDLPKSKNPTLTLKRGATYEFVIEAFGHPMLIKTEKTIAKVNSYNTGVTNNGADEGIITFTVPDNAPDLLFYVCEYHAMMGGEIKIIDAE